MTGVAGRVALVTGGGQGIGAAIAHRLAEDGAHVGLLDLNEASVSAVAAKIEAAGGVARPFVGSVTERADVERVVAELVASLGSLHILVNNAGVLRDNLLFKMSDDDWLTVMDVHLRGAFLCSQVAQKHMVEAKFGRIVSLSSTSALGNRGQANYSTAKAGLQGFTKTLAIELGPFGVTVNAVAPGFIETAMTAVTAERIGSSIDEMRARAAERNPVGRGGLPADVANAVRFFAAEESGFVTGQVVYIDGGSRLR